LSSTDSNVGVYQILAATLQKNTTYDLGIYAGCRADNSFCTSAAWGTAALGTDPKVELLVGATLLASFNIADPGAGQWADDTFTYNSGSALPSADYGTAITLEILYNNGLGTTNQVNFDDVTLATPEPSSLAIFGAALLGFGWLRRRRNSTALHA
jgi:hypothetical protein